MKSIIIDDNNLTIPLYHGTSTIFMENILNRGLGGLNPVKEWKLLELAKKVLELSRIHLNETEIFNSRHASFINMVDQKSEGLNWQHGDTYLSPSKSTAIRYAIDKRFGSELLTYTLDFLEELIRNDIPGVKDYLYNEYQNVFGFLEANPSPILVEIKKTPISSLKDEFGNDPSKNFEFIKQIYSSQPKETDVFLQQTNFRLCNSISKDRLKFWLINILEFRPDNSPYKLYEIYLP